MGHRDQPFRDAVRVDDLVEGRIDRGLRKFRPLSAGRQNASGLPGVAVARTGRGVGAALTERRRQLCAACWPITRRQLAAQRATTAHAALAALRASGQDPTTTPQAADKRSASLSKRKRQQLAWQPNPDDNWTPERYQTEILPRLAALPLSALAAATGLSLSACSRIRSGKLTPHRRHWAALLALPQG